jgi:type I restriction enzyme S subunit
LVEIASDIAYGYTAKSQSEGGDAKMLRITDIQNNRVNWSTVPYCSISEAEKKRYLLKSNDLVFARTGATVGKSFLIVDAPEAVYASYLIRVRCVEPKMARYLSHYFYSREYWQQITNFSAGIGQPNVNGSKLKGLSVPLAPLSEQLRIADKLDSLLVRVEACKARLEQSVLLLSRFRYLVLAAACSGDLTQAWRQENELPSVDARNVPERLPVIPSSWEWKHLSSVADVRGGVTKGRKLAGRTTISAPYLRVANVQDGYLDLREIKTIEVLPEDLVKFRLESGDVLFTEGGDRDKLGRGTVWHGEVPDSLHQNHIFRARVFSAEVDPEYLSIASKSDFSRRYFFENASQTVNLASINLSTLSSLLLPIPPLREQREIVTRVQALISAADRVESRLQILKNQVSKLPDAILTKAFRGELVPADPSDEPASWLLRRIRMAKERSNDAIKVRPEIPDKKTITKKELAMPSRKDLSPNYLAGILKSQGTLTAEALWSASKLEIDDFYDALREEEANGLLREIRSDDMNSPRMLEAA